MQKPIIVFEGVDGSGKSTVASVVSAALKDSILIHFPSEQTSYGKKMHQVKSGVLTLTPSEVLEAYILDMCYMIDALESVTGTPIIFDRYFYSTMVYQPIFNSISPEIVREEIDKAKLPIPDMTFLLDVNIDTVKSRLDARAVRGKSDRDIFDKRLDKIEQAITYYRYLAQEHAMSIIDATKPLDDVVVQCLTIIKRRLYGNEKEANRDHI